MLARLSDLAPKSALFVGLGITVYPGKGWSYLLLAAAK